MDTHDNSKEESNDNQDSSEAKPKEESVPPVSEDENGTAKKRVSIHNLFVLEYLYFFFGFKVAIFRHVPVFGKSYADLIYSEF